MSSYRQSWSEQLMLYDRVRGCLWGLAVGDAIGEPFEGLKPEEARGIKPLCFPMCTTDDTLLTIATLESVLELGYANRRAIAERMLSLDVPRMGPTTRASLRGYMQRADFVPVRGSTDGAAMRAGPIGLLFDEPERVVSETVQSSLTTHGESIAISAACAVACAVWACTTDESCVRWALWGAERGAEYGTGKQSIAPHLKRAVRLCHTSSYLEIQKSFGVGIESTEAVPCAIWLVARGLCFSETVLLAAKGGGDSDTIAAMAGCIVGARDGISCIPNEWREQLAPNLPTDIDLLAQKVAAFRGSHRG